jgi:putative ABC transport system ATP-binding protein
MTPAHLDHPAIIARGLTKTFLSGEASVPALRGVSLDIRRGEVTLLRGPSGSGKTTLLSIFGCILSPDGGSLRIGKRNVLGLAEPERAEVRLNQIGFIFQGFNLFPTLRVWENVAIALDLRGVPRRAAKARAEEVLARVGLAEKCGSLPDQLSGGQKQRVAIARAVVGDPTIILADEPTAALDWESGSSVMALLRQLATESGRAVVIVTHDERATPYADRIVTMRDGVIAGDEMTKASAASGRVIEAAALPGSSTAEAQGGAQYLRLAAG